MRLDFTRPFVVKCGRSFPSVSRRINDLIVSHFPEIDEIKIGYSKRGGYYAVGRKVVGLSPRSSNYHIGHELTHYLQYNGFGVPQGERSCDIFTFARSPVFCEGNAHYVDIPSHLRGKDPAPGVRRLIHDTAVTALKRRREGRAGYIKWFERSLRKEADRSSWFWKLQGFMP